MSALSPECRTIQKNTSKIIDAITNQSDPSAFSLQLVENDFISSQSANGIVQTMGPSNFNKVSQLMQAVESQIRTASNTTATFQTFIIILRKLSLGTLADQLDQFYRQLKSGHEASAQGGSSVAASTSLQQTTDRQLNLDDLMDITDYLLEFNETQIYHLGLVLGLRYTTMVEIKQSPTFRDDMIAAWLAKKDDVGKKGGPTWRNLANAMRHKRLTQNGLADRIASDKGLL